MKGINQENAADWIDKIQQFSPKAHEYMTKLENEILADGFISKKDKELILVGVNAAGRYERGMLEYTRRAVASGAMVEEIADIIATCIISRGIPAWLTGIKAILLAIDLAGGKPSEGLPKETDLSFKTLEDCLNYYEREFSGTGPVWVNLLRRFRPNVLHQYSNLRNNILTDHYVPRKLKEFVLIAINVCERYKEGIEIHVNNARTLGATDEEIAEVSLVGLLNAGIPGWVEGSDFL